MKISYTYKLKTTESVITKAITEEAFFDPLSEGENYEDHGVERYSASCSHCEEDVENIEWDEIEISESIKNNRTIKTEYFVKGMSTLIYRKDADGYELIIQSILISENKIFISRMEREDISKPWSNTNFHLGCNFEGGDEEEWYNLKKGELIS